VFDIDIIRQQLIFERTEIQQNLEQFIKDLNGGVADWALFKNDKTLRRQLAQDINTGKTKNEMAVSLFRRAHSLLDFDFPQQNLQTKLGEFLTYYDPLLNLNQTIITKLVLGVISMADPLNEKWNTINDIQILGAACYNNYLGKGNIKSIIVTDDKAIRNACKGTYMQNDVWNLKEYLSYIY